MGEAGEAFPAMTTLGVSIGMHERTVRDHLERVVSAGFLKKQRDGRRKTNVYSLVPDALCNPSDRVGGTGDGRTVIGSTAPVSLSKGTPLNEVVDVPRLDTESARRSLCDGVIGSAAQGPRVSGSEVTGVADPAIHLEENHLDDPQKSTLVRSSFGQSDESAPEELIQRLAYEVFNHSHGLGRKRSRKNRIAQSLRALDRNRVDLGEAVKGTIAIMHGPDAYNEELGGHAAAEKILRERRWESWTDDDLAAFA